MPLWSSGSARTRATCTRSVSSTSRGVTMPRSCSTTPGAPRSASCSAATLVARCRLEEHRLAVRAQHRHAHRGRGHDEVGAAQHLARLGDHLLLLAAVAVAVEAADLRHDVAVDRRGEGAVGRLRRAPRRPARPARPGRRRSPPGTSRRAPRAGRPRARSAPAPRSARWRCSWRPERCGARGGSRRGSPRARPAARRRPAGRWPSCRSPPCRPRPALRPARRWRRRWRRRTRPPAGRPAAARAWRPRPAAVAPRKSGPSARAREA